MGFVKEPVGAARQGLAAPPPRGAPAAREALLPAAARRGRADPRRPRPGSRSEAAGARLAALGYADPKAALRHLEALTSGVTRTANIQRTLLPAMLEWFADAPDPDAGLFGFRRISESLRRHARGTSRRCATRAQVAERLARLLATSRYATDLLEREPQGVRMLGGDLDAADRRGAHRGDAARPAGAPGRPREGGPRDPGGPAPRAVPDRGRRPARPDRRRRRRRGALPAHRRHARGHPRGRRAVRARAARRSTRRRPGWRSSRWAATAASSCPTAATPTCCSCTTREPGADPQVASSYAHGGGQRAAPAAGAARRATRRCEVDADLRPEGKQGPLVRTLDVVRRLLREVVEGLGGAGAAARRRGRRRPRAARRGSRR